MTIIACLIAAALFVAYANGANDNFKGVATLYGSGTIGYRGALTWATMTTFAGSICSVFLAGKLVKVFSAKGLVPDAVAATPEFLAAVALGAALTVFLATLTGFPISTTHALTGGLVGAGVAMVGLEVNFTLLGKSFFLPLLVSPVLAVILAGTIYPLFAWIGRKTRRSAEWCLCVSNGAPHIVQSSGTLAFATLAAPIEINAGPPALCPEHADGRTLRIDPKSILDAGHFLSAGAVSFARGLNDTPKIVGLMLVLRALDIRLNLLLVAFAMAVGGLLHARKVARTVSQRITKMDRGQGFTANLVTSLLVLTASHSGLPVSTTHVSCGSLFGMGVATKQANAGVIRQILVSWVLTLPIAAAIAAVAAWVLS